MVCFMLKTTPTTGTTSSCDNHDDTIPFADAMAALQTPCLVMMLVLPAWVIGGSMAVMYWQEGFDGIGNTGVLFLTIVLQVFAVVAGTVGFLIPLAGVCQHGCKTVVRVHKSELIDFGLVMASQCWCCVTCSVGVHNGTAHWVMWWWPGAVVFWVTLVHMVARAMKEARRADDADMAAYLINNPQLDVLVS